MSTIGREFRKFTKDIRTGIFGCFGIKPSSAVYVQGIGNRRFRIINVRYRQKLLRIEVKKLSNQEWVPLLNGDQIDYQD